jgi:magnesium chelatase family protein
MLAAIRSAAVLGIDAYDVTVEVDVALGLPQWFIVGLAASAVKESRERVGAALVNAGFTVPPRRITVNLAPADTRKEGTGFDLPIALGVLVGTGVISPASVERCVAVGELGLDGSIRPVRGALSIARQVASADDGAMLILPPTSDASSTMALTCPTWRGRRARNARLPSLQRGPTEYFSLARRVPERRCSPGGFRPSSPRSRTRSRSR